MTSTSTASALVLAGRVLLSFMFIMAGFAKLGDLSGTMAYTASGGIPGVLAIPATALEILGGVAILVGWQTRWAALALAAFCVAAGFLFHYLPAQSLQGMEQFAQMSAFYKNVTIAGGFLVLSAFGPGAYSLDARQNRRALAV